MITIKESYEKTSNELSYSGQPDRIVRKVTTYYLLGIPLVRTKRLQRDY